MVQMNVVNAVEIIPVYRRPMRSASHDAIKYPGISAKDCPAKSKNGFPVDFSAELNKTAE